MNTILPKFIDFNSNTSLYKGAHLWPAMSILIITMALAILGLIGLYYWSRSPKKSMGWYTIIVFATLCIILVPNFCTLNHNRVTIKRYNYLGFKIANTNLIATPYNVLTGMPTDMDPNKNYHKANYYVYVDLAKTKPMNMKNSTYVFDSSVDNITYSVDNMSNRNCNGHNQTIAYLGHMENGRFIPNYKNVKIVHMFTEYQKYIKKHKLESKFKHNFSFEISNRYFDSNNNSTLVAVGDNNFTLHYKNDSITKDSDIVQN